MATVSASLPLKRLLARSQLSLQRAARSLWLNLFSLRFLRNGFFKIGGCRGVCAKRLFSLGWALGTGATTTVRGSAGVRFLTLRENAAQLRARRARAARARRSMHQETAIPPNAESTPESWKSERTEQERSSVADERHDRSCPRRSLSLRSCARPDSHLCERGD